MMIKPFQSGDRVAFFGDSLTHAGSYHRFIRDYYFTRYPGIDLKTFNCGNGGGSAQGALFRMDMDLFNFQPNKVFVMFGMNDVDRYCYGVENPDAENLRRRKLALESYAEGMEALIRRLLEAKIEEIVLLSPTPYEEEAEMKEMNLKGTCEALIACREINDRLAEKYGCGTVDLFSPMLANNIQKEMEQDSAFYARCRGLSEGKILLRYALPSAVVTLLPSFCQMLGLCMAGSAIVERVFSLPGLGYLIIDSVLYRDSPVIHATILFLAFSLVMFNILSDILRRILQRDASAREEARL